MTGKERIEEAFSPKGASEIGAVIPYEGIFYRDHYEELLDCPWWYTCAPDLERQLAWHSQAMELTGQDWFYVPYFIGREERESLHLEEREEGIYRVNSATGDEQRLDRPPIGGEVFGTSGKQPDLPESEDQVDLLIPDVDPAAADHTVENGHADLAQALLEGPARDLYPICHVNSPLWRTFDLWGFEGMMMMTAMQPELVKRACERFLAHSIHGVRTAKALGAQAIWIEECLTDMISPASFEELNLPYLQRLTTAIHEAGMHSIYYYCGDPAGRLELLLQSGTEALALEEGKKGFRIDIDEIVREVQGRVVLLGNLDAVEHLEQADHATLKREIKRQLEAGQRNGGRFVMSVGSPVTPGTSVKRVSEYTGMVHKTQRWTPGLEA